MAFGKSPLHLTGHQCSRVYAEAVARNIFRRENSSKSQIFFVEWRKVSERECRTRMF